MAVTWELIVMEEREKERPVDRLGISKTWIMVWVVSTGIVTLVCDLVRPYALNENEFSVLVNVMNVISYVLMIGTPVFLLAGIVFGTAAARDHILASLKSGRSMLGVFLRRLTIIYVLVLIFSLSITSALFLAPYLSGPSFSQPMNIGFLVYLPSAFIATLAVSLLLASIGVFLATVSDDVIVSTILGGALTFGLATFVGYTPGAIWASVTRGIAMLSPSSIVRILAGSVSGYGPAHGTSLASYFGFDATLDSILLALTIFSLIAFAGLLASVKLFKINVAQWSKQAEIRANSGVWESELERQGVHIKIKRGLRIRRAALAGLVAIVLILGASGTATYSSMVVAQTTVVFYRSPTGGEQIDLGKWYMFSCDVQPSRYGQRIFLRYECYVEGWGNAPEEVSVYYSMLNMSSSDFQALNEASRKELCSYHNWTEGNWGGMIGDLDLEYHSSPFVFVMKVFATENETISGSMYFSIELLQKPW
jgi:hypothetical protein